MMHDQNMLRSATASHGLLIIHWERHPALVG